MVAPHECLHQQASRPLRRIECTLGLRRVPRQRLLAEHVLAGLERANRPFDVQPVRERDVHGLELGVVEEGFVARVCARNALLGRVRVRPALRPARDGKELPSTATRTTQG